MDRPQVFFNRPGKPFDLTLLLNDISAARVYVCLASAWFTDVAVADAVIAAPAPTKIVLLNAADLQRASVEAYTRLEQYFATTPTGDTTTVRGLFVLGGDDWRRDGMLHHKFVAVDPAWSGWARTTSRPSRATTTRAWCGSPTRPWCKLQSRTGSCALLVIPASAVLRPSAAASADRASPGHTSVASLASDV